jgi:hypothetical protein
VANIIIILSLECDTKRIQLYLLKRACVRLFIYVGNIAHDVSSSCREHGQILDLFCLMLVLNFSKTFHVYLSTRVHFILIAFYVFVLFFLFVCVRALLDTTVVRCDAMCCDYPISIFRMPLNLFNIIWNSEKYSAHFFHIKNNYISGIFFDIDDIPLIKTETFPYCSIILNRNI